MPHYTYSRGARRKKLFTRISSTFIKNKPNSNSSILESGKMLHSKSTYFYRWGSRLNYVVPSVCILALLFGNIITINPILNNGNKTYATGIKDTGDTGELTGSDTDNTPSISIAFPTTGLPEGYNNSAEQTTTVTPGVVAYRSNYFDVTVKNPSWYAVSVRAAKGYTSELKNADSTNPAAVISGVGENVTPNNFKENTWGYALTKVDSSSTVVDDTTLQYSTLPDENNTNIDQPGYITDNTISDHYKVSFATLFSGDMPSGHYTTKVYLSAVTNPGQVATAFANVGTMQDMADHTDSCKNAPENTTAQLVDERDGKFYWVTKLKDGNCWMTQNLDFDIPEKLSNTTSDVSSMQVATGISGSTNISNWTNSGLKDYNAYHDPGNYTYDFPEHKGDSGNPCDSIKNLDQCTTLFSPVSSNNDDMHYHIGNYYSFSAATAKTGDRVSNGQAPSSICPRGWKLPTSNTINNGSFAYLFKQYNMATSATNGTIQSGTPVDGITYKIYEAPFYFVYGGDVYGYSFRQPGLRGGYWSSTGSDESSSTIAYYLNFSSVINPSQTFGRVVGLSVRCVFISE